MLPLVESHATLEKHYQEFLSQLKQSRFSGDIETAYSSRLAVATDNSIYQALPQAVVFPTSVQDLQVLGELAKGFPNVQFSARGGGTGTNGQSLTSGLVVDLSRYMNRILEINAEEGWVRVQTGVVKDQLNDALRPHGFFFSPDLSTSNRATIGGMINTDASGQGSLVYGKTSDHVLALTSVLADGTVLDTEAVDIDSEVSNERYRQILQQVQHSCVAKREAILAKFPRLNRFLTGYDLEHAVSNDLKKADVSRLITGSEGSLCFVAEAKLNITPIPKFKALVNVKYNSFESALRHAPAMVAAQATSVETVDSKVLNLAKNDIVWHSVEAHITAVQGKDIQGLNIVEYNDEQQDAIDEKIGALKASLDNAIANEEQGVIGYQITYDLAAIGKIYGMRKKAVGLLGKAKGWEKPIAFAEDTAVPPENLADFIMEFRVLLDDHQLDYGMFGHVDAGVLHVRPALDMCDPEQEKRMLQISDQVVALVAKYGGLMWGEHGKGYRSEYGPAFFGEELFTELRKIKAVFDPHNQMNPGKICTPIDSTDELVKVADPKRGHLDKQIPVATRDSFAPVMSCNGNGLCFNYDTSSPMCPSSKITRDRRHSPKGRAGMLREWLRLLADSGQDVLNLENSHAGNWLTRLKNTLSGQKEQDFSSEVFDVMDHCLACKACTNQCPINVDIPTYRARFLSLYYQRYLRPVKDHLVANIESMAPVLAKMPNLVNFFLKRSIVKWGLKHIIGYVDSPLLSSPTLATRVEHQGFKTLDLAQLRELPDEQKQKTVLVVQDPFTSYYEANLVEDFMRLCGKLGYQPVLLPFHPNGKAQHVKGFLKEFSQTARTTSAFLNDIATLGMPMVGIDPSLVLCYRDEYKQIADIAKGDFQVLLPHEWLGELSLKDQGNRVTGDNQQYALLAHCTEKTMLPKAESQWQTIFADMGLSLEIVSVGCCGMAGTFGHENKHLEESVGIFNLSWQGAIEQRQDKQILATGYSCRSQVERLKGNKPKHPVQALLQVLSC
ncbi:MAG: FAD-binding and (Fe-S)-binding domain-containing protein [Aestuariibacter sp.]